MATASLAEAPDGARVFIDANIFIYHFAGPSPLSSACSAFLQRAEDGLLRGVTSTLVLIEVLHRLMVLEAVGSLRLPPREVTRYLKEHPEHVKSLHAHHRAPEKIHEMGVEVLSVGLAEIERSREVKARYGLLTNDALLVTSMQGAGLTALASNDPDFDRVEGMTLYRPSPAG